MRSLVALLGLQALMLLVSANTTLMESLVNQSAAQQVKTLQNRTNGCTQENVSVRKEWGTLSEKDRLAYINAVLCLQSKPPISPYALVPGARSRYWDWPKYSQDPTSSPLFDGSMYSISGNGIATPHGSFTYTMPLVPSLIISVPPGTGGGCVHDGPFAHMRVNLGPVNSNGSLPGYIGSGNGLDYNPRCLVRDIGPAISRSGLTYQNVTDLLTQSGDYSTLGHNIAVGVHAAGHYSIGGMLSDLYASPGDPAFHFHHAQVDRMWTIWQNLDIEQRQNQLQGSTTWFNIPPSPDITLSYKIDLGILAPSVEVGTLMSTVDGPFCYIYE